jgi:hypothetical protein
MVYVMLGLHALCRLWCPEIVTSSIDWVQLCRLLPEDGDGVQPPKYCILNKNRTMDNAEESVTVGYESLDWIHLDQDRDQ